MAYKVNLRNRYGRMAIFSPSIKYIGWQSNNSIYTTKDMNILANAQCHGPIISVTHIMCGAVGEPKHFGRNSCSNGWGMKYRRKHCRRTQTISRQDEEAWISGFKNYLKGDLQDLTQQEAQRT
ncbi:Reverse transcriptase [Phytophthora palmivora]|uniref:Reverse transcriptase n=1 Tax=Phytophthora palmivora TaxID=4796 RepID=A0A2P4YV93_9STRA|nr:Reverse transcriptase [Phytophthora palmivora]